MSQADDVTYTDADLLALLRAGDEAAIAQLVERWSPTMLRLARSGVADRQHLEKLGGVQSHSSPRFRPL